MSNLNPSLQLMERDFLIAYIWAFSELWFALKSFQGLINLFALNLFQGLTHLFQYGNR